MRVVVRFEDACQFALTRWRQGLSANRLDREALAGVLLDELKKRLVEFGGCPPGSYTTVDAEQLQYWVELSGGMWVACSVTRSGSVFGRTRVVHVTDAAPCPPPGAVPASLPG